MCCRIFHNDIHDPYSSDLRLIYVSSSYHVFHTNFLHSGLIRFLIFPPVSVGFVKIKNVFFSNFIWNLPRHWAIVTVSSAHDLWNHSYSFQIIKVYVKNTVNRNSFSNTAVYLYDDRSCWKSAFLCLLTLFLNQVLSSGANTFIRHFQNYAMPKISTSFVSTFWKVTIGPL